MFNRSRLKRTADDSDKPAAPEGGGGFSDAAMISLHCIRIYLDTTYRMTIDLLTEMPQICREIGRFKANLPHHSTLCLAFDRIEMKICRTLLQQSAQLHNTGPIGAIDATYFERSPGVALRARIWYREFRELALMYAVYNIKKAAEQGIPIPSGD